MIIKYAILGLLNGKSRSGYDIKKMFAESAVFYWSGNNNQIYKTLIQLHEEGLVGQEVQYQESLPARKVYTITDKGRDELRDWAFSAPQLPEFHNPFLIQLAWAAQYEAEALDPLLEQYEAEMHMQLSMQQEKARRAGPRDDQLARESYIWQQIQANISASYQKELDWVRSLRRGLKEEPSHFEGGTPNELPDR